MLIQVFYNKTKFTKNKSFNGYLAISENADWNIVQIHFEEHVREWWDMFSLRSLYSINILMFNWRFFDCLLCQSTQSSPWDTAASQHSLVRSPSSAVSSPPLGRGRRSRTAWPLLQVHQSDICLNYYIVISWQWVFSFSASKLFCILRTNACNKNIFNSFNWI